MAMQNYTQYLGKQVDFFSPVSAFGEGKIFERVNGVVSAVVLFQDLGYCEFFVDDNTYVFNDVVFLNK